MISALGTTSLLLNEREEATLTFPTNTRVILAGWRRRRAVQTPNFYDKHNETYFSSKRHDLSFLSSVHPLSVEY
jgi:hypothetical protein